MYETLLAKIGITLDSVQRVKDHFSYPKDKPDGFPCVFYFPTSFDNTFETGQENFKIYRFLMIVSVPVKGTTYQTAITRALAKTVDAIIAQFDADWDQGTIDGHRVWCKIDSADAWALAEEKHGLEAYAPLNLEIRLLTDTNSS